MAIRSRDFLYLAVADGSAVHRIASGARWVSWLNEDEVAFSLDSPGAPYGFQAGIYRASAR